MAHKTRNWMVAICLIAITACARTSGTVEGNRDSIKKLDDGSSTIDLRFTFLSNSVVENYQTLQLGAPVAVEAVCGNQNGTAVQVYPEKGNQLSDEEHDRQFAEQLTAFSIATNKPIPQLHANYRVTCD